MTTDEKILDYINTLTIEEIEKEFPFWIQISRIIENKKQGTKSPLKRGSRAEDTISWGDAE